MNAMAPRFVYTMKRNLQSDSNVLRIHFLHVMKRKPHIHDGPVMVDMANRLVEIAPSGRESPHQID